MAYTRLKIFHIVVGFFLFLILFHYNLFTTNTECIWCLASMSVVSDQSIFVLNFLALFLYHVQVFLYYTIVNISVLVQGSGNILYIVLKGSVYFPVKIKGITWRLIM
jgi:hypothetical protein